jgi:hypothetical protein
VYTRVYEHLRLYCVSQKKEYSIYFAILLITERVVCKAQEAHNHNYWEKLIQLNHWFVEKKKQNPRPRPPDFGVLLPGARALRITRFAEEIGRLGRPISLKRVSRVMVLLRNFSFIRSPDTFRYLRWSILL